MDGKKGDRLREVESASRAFLLEAAGGVLMCEYRLSLFTHCHHCRESMRGLNQFSLMLLATWLGHWLYMSRVSGRRHPSLQQTASVMTMLAPVTYANTLTLPTSVPR